MKIRMACGVLMVSAIITSSGLQAETKRYSYDARGRLIIAHSIFGPTGTITDYHFDGTTNRTAVVSAESLVGSLAPRTHIQTGQTIVSPDGRFALRMQPDGNLVLHNSQRKPLWATSSSGAGIFTLSMQNDGNLVLYNQNAVPVWASNTFGYNNYLSLQIDGNLVVYSATGTPLWASNTAGA